MLPQVYLGASQKLTVLPLQFFLEDVIDMAGYAIEETSPFAKRLPKSGGGGLSSKFRLGGFVLVQVRGK